MTAIGTKCVGRGRQSQTLARDAQCATVPASGSSQVFNQRDGDYTLMWMAFGWPTMQELEPL
jgi:hypothetical protein